MTPGLQTFMGLTLYNPVYRLAHSELHRVDSGNKKVYNTAIVPQGREFNPTTVLEGQMQILKNIWDGLAVIGFMALLYVCHLAWHQFQRAIASAKQSQQTHTAQTTVRPVEDHDIGVEVPWISTQKREDGR